MVDVETVDAASTIRLLEAIEAMYPLLVMIHVFLDNARYHHARSLRPFLDPRQALVRLDFLPPYSPALNPIERVWKLTRRRCLHNRYFPTLTELIEIVDAQFAAWARPNAMLRRLWRDDLICDGEFFAHWLDPVLT